MFFDWLMTSCSIFIHCKFYVSALGLKNVPRDTDLVTSTCNYGIGVQKWHRWELLTWRNFLLQNEIKYDLYVVGKGEDNLGCGSHLLLYLKQVSSVMIHCWPCQANWPVSFQGFPVFTSHSPVGECDYGHLLLCLAFCGLRIWTPVISFASQSLHPLGYLLYSPKCPYSMFLLYCLALYRILGQT